MNNQEKPKCTHEYGTNCICLKGSDNGGMKPQPKPEVCPKDCQGHVTDGVAHTCPPSPASTEVKCGCVPLHKEMQNGVEVYSQTTCFRHSKEYREPIEDVEQPTPASTEEWEKEFDEKFPQASFTPPKEANLGNSILITVGSADSKKAFIRSLLSSHDQQLRQRIVAHLQSRIDEVEAIKNKGDEHEWVLATLITFKKDLITNLK